MTDSQVLEILKSFNLSYDNLLLNFFRWIGWIILKGLAKLCGYLENAISSVFSYLNFAQIPQVQDFINTFRPVLWALLMISVIIVGINYTINRKFSLQGITINIFIVIAVFSSLTLGMDKLNEFTQASVQAIYSTNDNRSMADNLIKNSITDVLLWDQNNFSSKDLPQPNNFSTTDIPYIDINEVIDDDTTVNNEKVFENKIGIDVGGVTTLAPLDKGWFSWDEQYYRYQFSFGFPFIALLVMAIVTILVGIKAGRLIYEIVFGQLLVLIFSATDISSGQRTKKAIQYTMSCFFVIIFMVISLKIYSIFVPWISNQGGAGAILALIGFSWGVIDGPNIVQQLIGIDAGLSSAWKTAIGLGAAGKGLAHMGGKIGNSVKSHIQNRTNSSTEGTKTDNINQSNNSNLNDSKGSDSDIFNNNKNNENNNNFSKDSNNDINRSNSDNNNPKATDFEKSKFKSDNAENEFLNNKDNLDINKDTNNREKDLNKDLDKDLNKDQKHNLNKDTNKDINKNKNHNLNQYYKNNNNNKETIKNIDSKNLKKSYKLNKPNVNNIKKFNKKDEKGGF